MESQISSLEQGQDFRSHGGNTGPEHGKITTELSALRSRLKNWVRRTFDVFRFQNNEANAKFSVEEYPEFQHHLSQICDHQVSSTRFTEMQVTVLDLIEAVVVDAVFREVLAEPLHGCAPSFTQQVETPTYKLMQSGE